MDDDALTDDETDDLRCVAGLMVPASREYGVPGADDAIIFADILASLGRETAAVHAALAALALLAGARIARIDVADREAIAAAYRAAGGPGPAALERAILRCYYRDDRVVRSLGHDPRPPFPGGRTVEQGDWSLLDPVRRRAPMWRDPTTAMSGDGPGARPPPSRSHRAG